MENLYDQKTINPNDVFDDHYINAKALYLHAFNKFPDNAYIGQVDGEKAFKAFKEKFNDKIVKVYQYRWYVSRKKNINSAKPMSC